MKTAVILAVLLGAAFGAPTKDIEEIQRTKKSPSYGAPCGAPLAPVSLYLAQPSVQIPHYRENEHEEHNVEHARSYYDAPGAALAPAGLAGLSLPAAAASGPTVGVFPNAKVGGCAVPLLLSCAPNVVSGHLTHQGGYASPAAYRTLEHNHKMREVVPEKSWSEAERNSQVNPTEVHEAEHGHQLSHSSFQPAHNQVIQNMKH